MKRLPTKKGNTPTPSLFHINIHPHLPPGRTDLTLGLVIWRPGPKSCIPLGKFARFCFLAALGSPCRTLGLAGCLLVPSCFHFCFPSGHRAPILPATWLLFAQSCRILGALGSPFSPLGLAGVAPWASFASLLLLIGASGLYLIHLTSVQKWI